MAKIEKYIFIGIIIFCVIGLSYNYTDKIIKLREKKALKTSNTKKIAQGNITSISEVNKSNGKWIRYFFHFKGQEINGRVRDNFNYKCNRLEDDYLKKQVPIVFDSLKPEINFILFHKRDYVYFGYPIPDSMNWLFNYIEPSGSYIFSPAPISPDY